MSLLLSVPFPQDAPPFDMGYLWLGLAGLLTAVLVVAFAYVLLRRHSDWLGGRLQALDHFLARHAPRLWERIRGRFSPDAWHGLSLTVALGVFLAMIVLFAQITEGWMAEATLYRIDQSVNAAIYETFSDGFISVVAALTTLGGTFAGVGISAVVVVFFMVRRWWWRLLAFVMAVGIGDAVMWGLKIFFARTRPTGLLSTPASASFPSGHTFLATVLYGFLIYLVWRMTRNPWIRGVCTTVLTLVILFVGMSRVILSVHWVSDVLGGFTIGLAWLVFSIVFARALQAIVQRKRMRARIQVQQRTRHPNQAPEGPVGT